MRVAALGRTRILLNSIYRLHEAGHEIVLIGTCTEAPEYGVSPRDFEELACKLGVNFFNDARINSPEILELLKKSQADIAISVNWLTTIKEEAVSAFRFGILNAHAGDLPRYRGNACPNWAILAGEKRLTSTIHLMDPKAVDEGPIVLQRHLPLQKNTTIGDIYAWFYSSVPEMFFKAVEGLASGTIIPRDQPNDPSLALRCYPRIPADSFINWKDTAEYLGRLVRASSNPFNGAYTYWKDKRLTVWQAVAVPFPCPSLAMPGQIVWRSPEKGEVGVATGDGALVLQEVQVEGEDRVKASDVLTSTRIRLGMLVEDEIATLKRRIDLLENIILKDRCELRDNP